MADNMEETKKTNTELNEKSKSDEQKNEVKKKVIVRVSKSSSGKTKKSDSTVKGVQAKKTSSSVLKPRIVTQKDKTPNNDDDKDVVNPAVKQERQTLSVSKNTDKKTQPQTVQKTDKLKPESNTRDEKPVKNSEQTTKKAEFSEFGFVSQRPNIKAGNLADSARNNNKNHNTGNRQQKFQHNNMQGKRRESSFSGSQARAYSDTKKQGFKNSQNPQNKNIKGGYQQNKPFGFGAQRQNQAQTAAPIPVEKNKAQTNKKAYKGKKEVYSKKNKEEEFFEEKLLQQKKKQKEKIHNIPKEIEILENVSVSELARKMNLKASELIGKLMEMGMMITLNQSIDADTAEILASEYDCKVKIVSLYDETVIETKEDSESELLTRPPVVTIMGHVDHGKTKTLDAIRSSNVSSGEFGGITQHIGAYTVNTKGGKITVLDTPGHEAFTRMRARGAEVTDIVVLVVAADDGVMPQTIEAINHARDAKVPIIVAINKVDKPEANIDKVKTRLSELGLMPEEWGGDTMFVEISALKKQGIDALLETILLQAEVLELKANYNCNAEGKIIESKIDHGRGVVATIIVQRGTLRTGDPYVAGIYSGRVRAIFNDRGEKLNEATPSMPVEILGLEGMPNAGDPFQVTDSERIARQISSKRQELRRFEDAKNVKKVTLDNLYETINDGEMQELRVIIKGDVQGSVEALKQSLEKLSTKEIRLNVIHASAGAINESDVMLATADSNALIIGFNVRPTPQAKIVAEQEKVDIRKYNVIYDAVNEIKDAMEGMLSPDIKEQVIGLAEVRNTFKVPKVGKIAGCYVLEGSVKRSCLVNVIREGIVIHNGKISSLRHFKDDAKEVVAGFECGIGIENYNEIQVGDQFEIIETITVARKLSSSANYKAPEISTGDEK